MSRAAHLRWHASVALVLALALVGLFAAQAQAQSPWWGLVSEVEPTHLAPGKPGVVVAAVSDLSYIEAEGTPSPMTIIDRLPPGLSPVSVTASAGLSHPPLSCSIVGSTVKCAYSGPLASYERLEAAIAVNVGASPGTLQNELTLEGAGGTAQTRDFPVIVSEQPAPYGVQAYELSPLGEDGTPATQAGSQPFQLTTTLVMNQTGEALKRQPVALPKNLGFGLPAGLVGNPSAATQCSTADFTAIVLQTNLCPASSVVGVATLAAVEPLSGLLNKTVPVFNLTPAQGEPARFGFEVIGRVFVVIDTEVRTGRDYEVVASVRNASQVAGLLSTQVTLWGVPGDPRHDSARGWECVAGGAFDAEIHKSCPASVSLPQTPFLWLPTSCAANPSAEPVLSRLSDDSWSEPNELLESEYALTGPSGQQLGFEGCSQLPFEPRIGVEPEQHTASTPTGVNVSVSVPQQSTLEAGKQAEADVRNTTVTLPQGVQLSPAAANGLVACPESPAGGYEGIGFTGFEKFNGPGLEPSAETATFTPAFRFTEEETEGRKLAPSCPEASKLGTVEIETPLLSDPLEGYVYLASPAPNGETGRNPFDSLVALYIVAEDTQAGVLVKLAGEGELNESTLRVATTFRDAPQVPFSDLKLHLFNGPRASLSTPARCGDYATEALFTPWSGNGPVAASSTGEAFAISSGPGGGACPGATLPFSPGFVAQSASTQAGGFTSFDLELTRPDGDQALSGVTMHLPEGVAALLSAVELCSEAQAAAGACPAGSEVGEATAIAGLGPEPYVEHGGKVYITGPYGGAPFGLEIVTPAVAGPFNLGTVTVRSKLFINPENASVTIVSDSLPTQLRGIPLQLKRVLVSVNRPGFEFNPTNCNPMRIEGTITGAERASASVAAPFQVAGCQALRFAPTLTAATNGHASKASGTDFVVKVTSKGLGQANIAKVDLQLPVALPARLSTLQKACTEKAFDANPASCPEGSDIGAATIHTPVLKSALAGPAYLVSHGNAAFPDVEFVLQGEGITLVLDGKTQIKNGVTYSKFESAPDAPFTTFETVLPAGPHSALTANVPARDGYSLCGQNLQMPTTITGQNGDVIEQKTKIAVQGCAAVKAAKAKRLTDAQKLAKALVACRRRYRRAKARRVACERVARRHYPITDRAHKSRHAGRASGKR